MFYPFKHQTHHQHRECTALHFIIDLSDSDCINYHPIKVLHITTLYLLWILFLCDDTVIQMFSFIPHIKCIVGDDPSYVYDRRITVGLSTSVCGVSLGSGVEWNRYFFTMPTCNMNLLYICIYWIRVRCRHAIRTSYIHIFLHFLYIFELLLFVWAFSFNPVTHEHCVYVYIL